MMDRINEWHRHFPNQLTVVAMIHTIASKQGTRPANNEVHSSYQLSDADRIATMEAELFNLRSRVTNAAPIIRARAQKARATGPEAMEEIVTPTVHQASPEAVVPPVAITKTHEEQGEPTTEPEHLYQQAKDASYALPVNKNVGTPAKIPTTKKPEPTFKTLPLIHDTAITANVYKRSMEAPITVTQCKLLSISPEVRLQVREATTTRHIPTSTEAQPQAQSFITEEQDENTTTTSTYQHTLHSIPPEGATVVADPIENYYN